jgi:ribulose kinase
VAFESATSEALSLGIPVQQYLEKTLEEICVSESVSNVSLLTRGLHVWPDFHGNRSPVADPTLRGAICGLAMDTSVRNLTLIYLATLQSVAYGTKHIVQQMER